MATDKRTSPFLSKCYDMVDDPTTDPIISWGSFNTSFVIWDIIALQQELLPKYYNHQNLSSFIRQLNIYGFKKFDPARWEYTNDGFIKGQKHILRNITRKKSSQGTCQSNQSLENDTSIRRKACQGNCQQNQSQENNTSTSRKSSQGNVEQNPSQKNGTSMRRDTSEGISQQNPTQENDTSAGACVEVGKFPLWEDVEILKNEKNLVMQELAKLSHHQQGADGKLHHLGQRLKGMEISQQQMLSFLAMVVQSPGFLGQLLLQQNESNWRISDTSKKRRFLALEQGTVCNELEQDTEGNEPVASDGQIVRYQPPKNDRPKTLLVPTSNWDGSQQFDPSANALDDFFRNNVFNEPVAPDGQIVRYQPLNTDRPTPLPTPKSNWDGSQQLDPSANGLDDFFRNIDLMPSVERMPVPVEENGHCKNDGQIVIPYLLEDGTLEKFLLATSLETAEQDSVGTLESSVGLDSTNHNTLGEPSQALDRLTKELGLLVSKTNNEHGES